MDVQNQIGSDELYTAIATLVLVEVAKRLPDEWVPLRAENVNDVKLVAGIVSLVASTVRLFQTNQLHLGDLWGSLAILVKAWLIGWFLAQSAYKAMPYLRPQPETPVLNDEEAEAQA